MFEAFRGLAAVLTVAAAPLVALAPSTALAQSKPPPIFDTSIAPLPPIEIPHASQPASVFFPARAQRLATNGHAVIDCAADTAGVLTDCQLVSEAPDGWGFGAAALKAAEAKSIRQIAMTAEGRTLVSITFDARNGTVDSSAPGKRVPPLRVAGPPVAAQVAGPDQTLIAFPFAFNRTGVLAADATGYSIWVKGVLAPAGSPGFYAGTFGLNLAKVSGEVWCFPSTKTPAKALCLMVLGKLAIILPNINPYVITGATSSSGTFNYANAPVIEEKSVAIPGDLRMEYRFRRWKDSRAEVEELAGGRRVTLLDLPLGQDGRARLQTLAGDYWLSPAPNDSTRAEVSVAAP
jgi:hypothetical protein